MSRSARVEINPTNSLLEWAELDENGEPFTPHCYRSAAITRWTKLGILDAIVRRCSGHANRDVHEDYIQFTDQELVEAFDAVGLLSPPPAKQEERAVANAGRFFKIL